MVVEKTEYKFRPTTALRKIQRLVNEAIGNAKAKAIHEAQANGEAYRGIPKQVFIIRGGQGASKTIGLLQLIIDAFMQNPKVRCSIYGAEYSKMVTTIIQDTRSIIQDYGYHVIHKWKESPYIFKSEDGGFVEFKGLDTDDIGKGSRREIVYFNEANRKGITLEKYRQISSRAKIVFIDFNPDARFWVERIMEEDNVHELVLTFEDNEFFPENEKQELLMYKRLAETSEYYANKWRVYGLGEYGRIDSKYNYYPYFNENVHTDKTKESKVTYNPNYPLWLTIDFNNNPYLGTELIQFVDSEDEYGKYTDINVLREYALPNPQNTPESVANKFVMDYNGLNPLVFLCGDPTGDNKPAGYANVKTPLRRIEETLIRAEGIRYNPNYNYKVMKVAAANEIRRDVMHQLMSGGLIYQGRLVRLNVSGTCNELIEDFMYLKIEDGRKKKNRVKNEAGISYEEHGHTSDALEYAIEARFPNLFKNK